MKKKTKKRTLTVEAGDVEQMHKGKMKVGEQNWFGWAKISVVGKNDGSVNGLDWSERGTQVFQSSVSSTYSLESKLGTSCYFHIVNKIPQCHLKCSVTCLHWVRTKTNTSCIYHLGRKILQKLVSCLIGSLKWSFGSTFRAHVAQEWICCTVCPLSGS